MSTTLNNLFKNILCLTIAVLLSLTELQFFGNIEIFSLIFLIILSVTVPTIYLYFLPKQDTILIFIYNIVLAFMLELLGKDFNIGLFLISLFCITLLFCQSVFTENARRFMSKEAAYKAYCMILIFFLLLTVVLTFLIYEYILKPNLNNKLELSILFEDVNPEANDQSQSFFDNNSDENIGDEGGGGAEEPKISFLNILLLFTALLICFAILYIAYKFIRYRIWLEKTLKSSNNEKVYRIYIYILDSLSLLGMQKKSGETPFEYMALCDYDDFPLSELDFSLLTNAFVSTYYGKKEASAEDCDRFIVFLRSISKKLREKMGTKEYVFKYLIKK